MVTACIILISIIGCLIWVVEDTKIGQKFIEKIIDILNL